MLRTLPVLLGLLCAFSVQAQTNQEMLKNLNSRIQPLSEGRGVLIKSFEDHNQSYIYDQALAVITFTKANDKNKARELLRGLQSLQMKDGSLYFSYYLDGSSPYPEAGDKRIAGAISWVALAAVHYQKKFNSKEFLNFNFRVLNYLHSQIRSIEIQGTKTKALSFAPKDVKSTAFEENQIAALEHNLDAYAAFLHFSEINKTHKWKDEINHLKTFILAMWDGSRSNFWSGAEFKKGSINKSEYYLDNQTWSLLALDQSILNQLSPDAALTQNCDQLFVDHKGVKGLMDSKPTRRPANQKYVWSEGTLGQILAMKKMEKLNRKKLHCNDLSADDLLTSIKQMKQHDGGIAYATLKNADFTTSSSVAGTTWMYFALNDINPFELN